MKYRLAFLASHPIQYQAPLFRSLAEHPEIDLTVYFCWDFGAKEAQLDPGFGIPIKWDVPLLEGYRYKFLPNRSPRPSSRTFGLINPSIIGELRRFRYDALIVHGYASVTNWLAFFGAGMSGTPVLLRGESHLLKKRSLPKRAVKRALLRLLFKRVSAFLPIGALNRAYYLHYGVPEDKLFPVPYAVDNDFFSGMWMNLRDRKNEIRQGLGISPEKTVILFASKLTPRKRAMDLLRAYEAIQDEADAALVFVGDGAERDALESYASGNRLRDVYFVGFKNQTELPEYFTAADVFVLPSVDEPWGLVVNEALNFGLPVVASDEVGAAPDLVRDGNNGFIYPAGDVGKLSFCLSRLLRDRDLRLQMCKRSLKLISRWGFKEDIHGILTALAHVAGDVNGR